MLAQAYEYGITYFDVARSYGYGEAESIVGEYCAGKRDKIHITTKAGFTAARLNLPIRAARTIVAPLATIIPSIRPLLRKRAASSLVSRPALTPMSLRASVETSLRELRTDFVDTLLLHEATADELADGRLLAELRRLLTEGKIRSYGVGSDLIHIPALLASSRAYLQVLQMENNPAVRAFARFDLTSIPEINTYRAVGPLSSATAQLVARQPRYASRWRESLGIDLADPEVRSALFLAYSLRANTRGRVLFSTNNVNHLKANVETAANLSRYSLEQFRLLEEMMTVNFRSPV